MPKDSSLTYRWVREKVVPFVLAGAASRGPRRLRCVLLVAVGERNVARRCAEGVLKVNLTEEDSIRTRVWPSGRRCRAWVIEFLGKLRWSSFGGKMVYFSR